MVKMNNASGRRLAGLYQELTTISLDNLGETRVLVRAVLMGLIVLAIWLFGYLVLISYGLDKLSAASHQESTLIEEYSKKTSQIKQLKQLEQKQITLNTQLEQTWARLPISAHHLLLEEIERLAQANQIHLISLTNGSRQQMPFYDERSMSLVASGSYHDFGRFLAELTQASQLITVHDFQIHKGDDHRQLQVSFQLKSYQRATKPKTQEMP